MSQPLVLLGFPRSGTTLLRSILSAHSAVSLTNEIDLVPMAVLEGRALDERLGPEQRAAYLETVKEAKADALRRLPAEQVARFRDDPRALSIAQMQAICAGDGDGLRYFGDKSVLGIFYLKAYTEALPGCRFIYLHRDPRAAIFSKLVKDARAEEGEVLDDEHVLERLDWRAALDRTAVLTERWAMTEKVARNAEERLGKAAWHAVGFERLLREPEKTVGDICAWLDLDFETAMLDPAARSTDTATDTEAGRRAHPRLGGALETARATAYRKLPAQLLAAIQSIAADAMEAREYPAEPIDPAIQAQTDESLAQTGKKIEKKVARYLERFVRPGWALVDRLP